MYLILDNFLGSSTTILFCLMLVALLIGIVLTMNPEDWLIPRPPRDIPGHPDKGIRKRPVPGRKCPNCAAKGTTVWVIPGKSCPQCGTPVN